MQTSEIAGVAAAAAIALSLVAVLAVRRPSAGKPLPPPSDEVAQLARAGRRVAAVRHYRRQTGASLLDAARVVDGITATSRSG